MARLRDLFHAECAKQVPAAISRKAGPVGADVSPKQSPKQQNVADCDASEGSGSRIRTPVAIAETFPIRVGMGTASPDTTHKRKGLRWIPRARLGPPGRERHVDERSVREDRAARFGAVARVRTDVHEID